MKVLFCGYRDWAHALFHDLMATKHNVKFHLVNDEKTLESCTRHERWDIVLLVGWSWIVPDDIINNNLVMCIHPSDLPDYAGGSPLQNQILDGMTRTKVTLFKVDSGIDTGDIFDKRPMSLEGHVQDVFNSLIRASSELISDFIDKYPNHVLTPQREMGPGFVRKRLKPAQSQLFPSDIQKMTCRELWNFIRCRENPYPNAFLKDETGTLIFKRVEFDDPGKDKKNAGND